MNASGYNDKAKLAAALELARSFKSGKQTGTKGSRGSKGSQAPRGTPVALPSKFVSNTRPPLPSQRNYNGIGKFGMPAQNFSQAPLIGSADLDFLSRRDQAPAAKGSAPQVPGQLSAAPVTVVSQAAPDRGNVSVAHDAAKSATVDGSGTISVRKEATDVEFTTEDGVFSLRKPGGVAPGSVLDDFLTLVGGDNNSTEKPAEADESLIDFGEGDLIALEPGEQESSMGTDWLGSEVNDQSSTLMDALSARPPVAEAKTLEDKPATGSKHSREAQEKGSFSPQAPEFVPAEAVAPGHNVQTSGDVPQGSWLSPVPVAAVPSMAYMIIVPMPGVAPFAGQQTFQAQAQMVPFAALPCENTQAQEMPEVKRVRKPKGGLSTSKWAS
ncbi:hypothetical protein HRG_006095 [Hirsutella rhossiliensis]|uniref:Uncharacterized protein n=1 Tax=Hirsutella rhossiliensis TaxID=111463 RepID=A0A9P8MYH7_9HYPO|nr:uncharacterized protein HRG_06095 [Hirsutella rhossiliensis]KAH0963585.1 hypothetical protein HRG_06095 [Hirsutella rhossiliensis]